MYVSQTHIDEGFFDGELVINTRTTQQRPMSNAKISVHLHVHTVRMYKLVQVANTTLFEFDPTGNTVPNRLGICIGGNASSERCLQIQAYNKHLNIYIVRAHMCKYMYIQGIVIIHVHNVHN